MPLNHVLLCLVGVSERDPAIAQTADLCRASGAKLSVIVPVIDAVAAGGCCGIQGDHWQRLLDEQTAEAVRDAVAQLARLRCRPETVEIVVGRSIAEVVEVSSSRLGCDRVVVNRRHRPLSGSGLSRRQVASLRRAGASLDDAPT